MGLHAVLIVGYDDETETYDILNSHGPYWGDGHGYFRMKYEYAMSDLCFEFYCIHV